MLRRESGLSGLSGFRQGLLGNGLRLLLTGLTAITPDDPQKSIYPSVPNYSVQAGIRNSQFDAYPIL